MLVRSFLLIALTFLFASECYADAANWDCQQDKKTKVWNCLGTTGGGQAAEAKPQPKIGPVQDANSNAKTPDIEPKSASTADAKPKTIEPAAETGSSVSTKTDKTEAAVVVDEAQKPPKKLEATETLPEVSAGSKSPTLSEAPPPEVLPASEKPVSVGSKPTAAAVGGNRRGWQCDTKDENGNWNCQLVGADPKGEARVVETEGPGFTLFDPAFDSKEELVFNTLRDRFKNNPWGNCTIQLGTQKYFLPDKKKQRDYADIDMNSNAAEVYDNEIGNYRGNVDMKRADQRASSNAANYDSVSELLDLHGNVFYSEDELSLYTESANIKLASDEAKMRDTLFISPTTPIRGKASAVYRDSKLLSRYKDAAYTSCEPGNQDWVVHATDLKMNKETGDGSAKNAWLEFKGIPVFYSPYLSFPIDSRRKSGFLAPNFGNTQLGGFSFSAPFYWNIAPNYDATLRPRYYTKRGDGLLLAGDFRYMTEMTRGQVSAEYLSNDNVKDFEASEKNKKDTFNNQDRYLASIKNSTRFTKNISSNLDLNIVSDTQYFQDLGNALSFPNFSHLRSFANASYIDTGVSMTGIVESFQTIDRNLRALGGRFKPYRRLPQLNFNFDHSFQSIPANATLETEYVYFQHDDSEPGSPTFDITQAQSKNNIRALPSGHRFNIKPSVSFPLKAASAYITPKVSLQYTQYLLENQPAGKPDNIGRVLPIGSIDSGLFLEKDLNIGGNSFLHALEPRLFYLYIPKVKQDDIPVFDTSLYDFQYDSLFRENRFSGNDRIQDANQVTVALTSRLVDTETGLERLKVSVGNTIHFQDREVTLPDIRVSSEFLESPIQNSTFSPIVGELSSQINKHFSIDTGLQWDPDVNEVVRAKAYLHFVNDPGEIINVGYLYRNSNLIEQSLDRALSQNNLGKGTRDFYTSLRNNNALLRSDDIIQTDVSFRWPIYDDWFAIGRWQYSMLYNQTQDGFLGVEKENCCWRFRIIGRRFVNNIVAAANPVPGREASFDSQTGVFFQIEFKGLTGLGENLDKFFTQSIYGYQKINH